MAIVWNEALYKEMYRSPSWMWGVRNSSRIPAFHYHWFTQQNSQQAIIEKFLALPGAAQVSDLAIVGGGFGWTAELLESYGINAISIDTSSYIQNTKAVSEEQELRSALTEQGFDPDNLPIFIGPDYNTPVNPWNYWLRPDGVRTSKPVLPEDLSSNGSRRSVRQALGNNIDAILTEFALESVETEAEALTIVERCEQLRPNPACQVIHMVTGPPGDPRLLTYTPQEWRTVLNNNGFNNHYVVDTLGNVI